MSAVRQSARNQGGGLTIRGATAVFLAVLLASLGLFGDLLGPAVIGTALLFLPGAALLGRPPSSHPFELPALWFAASLCVFAAIALASLVASFSVATALLLLATATALSFWVAKPRRESPAEGPSYPWLLLATAVAMVSLAAAAAWLTSTGSIDRWWYLAYVRRDLLAPVLSATEPFFGSGHSPARFAANPWLLALTAWSWTASLDPLTTFHSFAPPLLVVVFTSAAFCLGRLLLQERFAQALVPLCSIAVWLGGLLPVVTRGPEDKILAVLALAPVATTAALRHLDGDKGWLPVFGCAALALAALHPLVFALFLLSMVVPVLGCLSQQLSLRRARTERQTTTKAWIALGALALATTLAAGASGLVTKTQWEEAGAIASDPTHPVLRVHAARARTIHFDDDTWIVDPGLLAHAPTLVAFAGLAFVSRASPIGRLYILGATLLPLAIAFLPPLSSAAGRILLPWMVYRVLWIVPSGFLLALLLDGLSRRRPASRPLLIVALIAGLTLLATLTWEERTSQERRALAPSEDPQFLAAIEATKRLPSGAVVATAPELAERLPGLAGTFVLAASDRATFVFTGSPPVATKRLRSLAALNAGVWNPDEHLAPTHILAHPDSRLAQACANRIWESTTFVLCVFEPSDVAAGPLDETSGPKPPPGSNEMAASDFDCAPGVKRLGARGFHQPRPGPWSATPAILSCRIAAANMARSLRIVPRLGLASDEYLVVLRSPTWKEPIVHRLHAEQGKTLELALPASAPAGIGLEITPTKLPFVKLESVDLVFAAGVPAAQQNEH